MIHCALQVSSSHHLHCFLHRSIAHPLLAKRRSDASLSFCAHINTVLTVARFSPVAVTRHKLCMLGHWSLSFQYSRWWTGFFHRVFAFVRVEQKLESCTSPSQISSVLILFVLFLRASAEQWQFHSSAEQRIVASRSGGKYCKRDRFG